MLVTTRRIARQGAILLHRNMRLLLADRCTLVMAAVQSVLMDMTAQPAARGAAIVAARALAFLLIAYLVTPLRHRGCARRL